MFSAFMHFKHKSMSILKIAWKGYKNVNYKIGVGTSLVAQWLRICLPMRGTWVRSLFGKLRSHLMHSN